MRSPAVLQILVAVAFVTACAPTIAQPPPAGGGRRPANRWQLTLHVSGGVAGLDRSLDLASSGETRATDLRLGTRISRQAAENELAAALKAAPSSRNAVCRDCLEYSLDLQRGAERLVFQLDDSSLSRSDAEPLVSTLAGILNRLLAGSERQGVAADSAGPTASTHEGREAFAVTVFAGQFAAATICAPWSSAMTTSGAKEPPG